MLASCSSLALGRPAAAVCSQRAAFRPAHIAPVVARRSQLVVCQAAEVVDVESAPVVAVAGPKEGVAHLNFQRGSAHKARRVLDCIRGRSYEDAIMMMEYMPHRMCEKIIKALKSAAANAKENRQAAKSKLVVAECYANEGPTMKRFQPRAQGRAYPILKPTFHMTIRLAEQ